MKLALRLAIDFVVVLMVGGILTVNATASSLPGDPLYSVKRTWEEVRLTLTLNDPARQQLQDQFQQLRLKEVREMIQMGKTGMVEFDGRLESIAAEEWVVSGIRVRMLPDTIVEGNPEVGLMVQVRARLQSDGTLTALQVHVQTQLLQPGPYSRPVFTHTSEPPRSTYTAMPSPMPSRTPSPTLMPSQTPSSTSTWEPTHVPTYQPTRQPRWNDDHHHNNDCHNNCCCSCWWGCGSGSHHR